MSFWKGVGKLNDLIDVSASSPNDSEALVWVAANQRWEPVAGGGGGQSNTASNIGVGGVGLYQQKISADLQFRNINAADAKITVSLDAGNNEVDIGLGSVALDDLSDIVITTVADNEILQYDNGSGNWINQTLAEAGISAVGHAHATSDITSGTFDDARIAESNVTQHVAAIDHDSLLNFVANEHIDHTSVTLTAGSGLSGGGDISASRSFAVDINGLTEDATPSAGNDYVMTYDASATALKKVLLSNLPGGGGSSTLENLTDTSITSVASGEILKWDGADWINNTLAEAGISAVGHSHTLSDISDAGTLAGLNAVAALDDITDVTITTIASGELLKWNGSAWINNTLAEAGISAVGHSHTLSDISDAGTLAGLNAVAALDDITDVTITTIASGELLKWNGSAWINNTLAEAGISAVGHAHATSDITSGTFDDARIAESNVTQHVAAIDHDSLLNFVANEHIDWTSTSSNFVTTGTVDLNGSSWFKVPVSATPTVDADGKIALDTTVTDFSHGVLKYYGGEEMAIVSLPIAELTSPTNAHVIAYNSTNDEFELVAQTGGGASALDDLSDVVIASAATGDMLLHDGTDWDNKSINDLTADASPDGAADYVMTWDASASDVKKVLLDNLPGGGGGGFQAELNFPLASMRVNTALSFPPVEYVDLGTVEDYFRAFDDTTQEYVVDSFSCPSDIDTSGTVTFEVYGKRSTGTAASNIYWDFDHRAVADAESGDGSYTTESSGALAIDTTTANLDRLTWTETVSNLGWAANDLILFRLSRDSADAGDTLTGDYYGWNFRIIIPRA